MGSWGSGFSGFCGFGIMSFEAPPGKRLMFGYLMIDWLNSVSGMSISERTQRGWKHLHFAVRELLASLTTKSA